MRSIVDWRSSNSPATVMPMVKGTPTRSMLPRTLLPPLVMPKITKAKMKVPQASVSKAPATDLGHFGDRLWNTMDLLKDWTSKQNARLLSPWHILQRVGPAAPLFRESWPVWSSPKHLQRLPNCLNTSANRPGLGKYSPNAEADKMDLGSPRVMPFSRSKAAMVLP